MTFKLAAILSAALIFGAQAVKADETFDLFQMLCVATNAHMDQTLAAAEKAGWMPMPQTMMEQLNGKLGVKDTQARISSTTTGLHMLLIFDGAVPNKHFSGRFCFVATFPSETVDFDRQVTDFAKVPSVPDLKNNFSVYVWKEEPTGHVAVGFDDKSILDALATGELHVLMTRRDKDIGGLILMIPTSVDTSFFGSSSPKPQ